MTLEGKDASDDDIDDMMRSELPSLKPPSEKVRQEAVEKRVNDETNQDAAAADDDGDEDYRKRPAKLMRFAAILRNKEDEKLEKEAVSASLRKKCLKSQKELADDFFKILKQFFKAAFTIIVKRRRLCPAVAFQAVKVLGVDVPKFLHPASLEYVEEVAKKLLLFLNRNITEGCVIHIMIEKNKTLHVVQRFVFRVVGSLNFLQLQNTDTQDFDLEEVEKQCASSLLDILNCDLIQPMTCPQFSRWSISLGIKTEFMCGNEEYLKELWTHDPSGGYFPWKKRQKSLASTGRRVSCRLEFPKEEDSTTNQISCQQKQLELPMCSTDASTTQEPSSQLVSKCDGNVNQSNLSKANPTISQTVVESSSANPEKNKCSTSEVSTPSPRKLITKHVSSRRHSVADDVNGIVCLPVSSFQVIQGVMFAIYGLEYPAPRERDVTLSSIPAAISSAKHHGRSPGASVRLPHIRHRLLKKF